MHATVGGIEVETELADLCLGIVVARAVNPRPNMDGLERAIDDAIARARTRSDTESITQSVRKLLRRGAYKPSGRQKPASEYLLEAARSDRFPRIHPLVDINNLVSLESLLPISLIDLERADATRFVVRLGQQGESYVFNPAGQTIDVSDLIVVASYPAGVAVASPVKDSMRTKLTSESRHVMAIVYAPPSLAEILAAATQRFSSTIQTACDVQVVHAHANGVHA